MKFDNLTVGECLIGVSQNQKSPVECPLPPETEQPTLVLKPETATIVVGSVIQYRTYVIANGIELEVTQGLTYRSSDMNLAIIGAIGGSATGLAEGIVTIGVEWQGLQAFAQLNIINSCSEKVNNVVMLFDISKSSSQTLASAYGTKLAYAKKLGRDWINASNLTKDKIAIVSFDEAGTVELALSQDKAALLDAVNGLNSTIARTNIDAGLTSAISEVNNALVGEDRIVILFSDGKYNQGSNPKVTADAFKSSGGTIICIGLRCDKAGFIVMENVSTKGLLLNAYDKATADADVDFFSAFRGYLCQCAPKGDVTVPTPTLNYAGFANWDVTGVVDLIGQGGEGYALFDFIPGHGMYLDLVGSSDPWIGKITSKTAFMFTNGVGYELKFKLAGNQRVDVAGFTVRVKVEGIITQDYKMDDWRQDFTEYTLLFSGTGTAHKISIEQLAVGPGTQSYGNLLDNVQLAVEGGDPVLLIDTFDGENSIFHASNCDSGNSGYGGSYYYYHCPPECLKDPPPAQKPDPNELPDIEAETPPKQYTATKSYTACCTNAPTTCQTKEGTAASSVSQADADQKALALAQQNAEDALSCPDALQVGRFLNFMARPPGLEPGVPRKVGLAASGVTDTDFWNYLFDPPGRYKDNNQADVTVEVYGQVFWGPFFLGTLKPGLPHPDLLYRYQGSAGNVSSVNLVIRNLPFGNYRLYVYGHGPEISAQTGKYHLFSGKLIADPVGGYFLDGGQTIHDYGELQTSNVSGQWDSLTWAEGNQYVVYRNIVINNNFPGLELSLIGTPQNFWIAGFQILRTS